MKKIEKSLKASNQIAAIAGSLFLLSSCSGVGSAPSFGDLFAAAPQINSALNILSFDPSPRSGHTENQQFEVFIIPSLTDALTRDRIEFVLKNSPPGLEEALRRDCLPSTSPGASYDLTGIAATAVIEIANLIFDKVFDQLAARVEQVRRASEQDYQSKVILPGGVGWNNIECVLLARSNSKQNELPDNFAPVGLTVLIKKTRNGDFASTFEPLFIHMDHAVAITGNEDQPKVKLDITFAIHASDQVKQRHEIYEVAAEKLLPVTVPIGTPLNLCRETASNLTPCFNASPMFPNPTAKSGSAVSLTFSLSETGSAARDVESAKSGIEALRKITKPKLDELLKAAINQ